MWVKRKRRRTKLVRQCKGGRTEEGTRVEKDRETKEVHGKHWGRRSKTNCEKATRKREEWEETRQGRAGATYEEGEGAGVTEQ